MERYSCQFTSNFEELITSAGGANKQFAYRYISKESLVARSEVVREKCQRECKFIVFGEVNKDIKEAVPVFLWRHVELFTNHEDRVY